jgi:hypothetical protein
MKGGVKYHDSKGMEIITISYIVLAVLIFLAYPVGLISDKLNNNCHSLAAILLAIASFLLFSASGWSLVNTYKKTALFFLSMSVICDIITFVILKFKVSYDTTKCEVIPGTTTLKEDSLLIYIIFGIVCLIKLCGVSLIYSVEPN